MSDDTTSSDVVDHERGRAPNSTREGEVSSGDGGDGEGTVSTVVFLRDALRHVHNALESIRAADKHGTMRQLKENLMSNWYEINRQITKQWERE